MRAKCYLLSKAAIISYPTVILILHVCLYNEGLIPHEVSYALVVFWPPRQRRPRSTEAIVVWRVIFSFSLTLRPQSQLCQATLEAALPFPQMLLIQFFDKFWEVHEVEGAIKQRNQ